MGTPNEVVRIAPNITSNIIDNNKVAQEINHKLKEKLGKDFTYIKHIGAGVEGNVYLCEYTGTDKKIRSICDVNNRISVKILFNKNEIKHEAEIAYDLYKKLTKKQKQARHNIGIPIKKNRKTIALVMQYISYNASPTEPLEDSLKSYLKKFYQVVVAGSVDSKNITNKMHKALYDDYGIMFAQLINEMHTIMYEFHKIGYLHLDIAARNFILSNIITDAKGNPLKLALILCDYGHSGKMTKRGIVNTHKQQGRKPVTARNYHELANNIASVQTDIFAFKCAVIGMLSLTVANLMHDYNVLSIGQESIKQFKEMRVNKKSSYQDDLTVLNSYFNKLSDLIRLCCDTHIKKQAKEFINSYKKYLLAIPSDDASLAESHDFDYKLLLNTNTEFFKTIIQSKIKEITDVNHISQLENFLLSIKRLMEIPLPNDFKNSEQYIEIKGLDSIEKVQKYLIEKYDSVSRVHVKQGDNIGKSLVEGSEKLKWIDMLDDAIRKWNLEHNELDVKWYGKEFEKQVNAIINKIIKGEITLFNDVTEQLNSIAMSLTDKITQQKLQPNVEFKNNKILREITTQNLQNVGYEITQTRPKEK